MTTTFFMKAALLIIKHGAMGVWGQLPPNFFPPKNCGWLLYK